MGDNNRDGSGRSRALPGREGGRDTRRRRSGPPMAASSGEGGGGSGEEWLSFFSQSEPAT